MKIVLTTDCSFDLSMEVIKKYFELCGLSKPYFYKELYYHVRPGSTKYFLIEDTTIDCFFVTTTTYYGNETTKEVYGDGFFDSNDIRRDDINLIKAIEILNPEYLKIVEIPDDVKWYIHESESGQESIHEEHRIWV